MPQPIRRSESGVIMDVLVVPNSSRSIVVGIHGARVKVKIAAPPAKNRANAAVAELMSEVFGVRTVHVVAGRTTRFKTLELVGASIEAVEARLAGR